jgi:hypothetical protein
MERLDDAREIIKKALKIAPSYRLKMADRLFPYRLGEDRKRVIDGLRKAGLPEV